MNHKIKLSALFMKEVGGAWVGQCMEYDIAAQGKTLDRAKIALQHTLAAQLFLDVSSGKTPLQGIPPAPKSYKAVFEKAEKLAYHLELSDDCNLEVEDVRLAVA